MNEQEQHFEFLWETAEQIVNKIYGDLSNVDKSQILTQEIEQTIKILEDMKLVPLKYDGLMYRKMGQLLFKLTQISFLTNINTYRALQDEMKYQELEAKY